jgi:hypothetical protein
MQTRRRQHTTLRIGPISLLTLVMALCLAVMGVLCAVTAEATYAMSVRQAESTTDGYLAEEAGQQLVAQVGSRIASARATGADKAAATSAISADLDAITSATEASANDGQVSVAAKMSGASLVATITTRSGHVLDIQIDVNDQLGYDIAAWKLSTMQDTDSTDAAATLWSGSPNEG